MIALASLIALAPLNALPVGPGDTAPNFRLRDRAGRLVRLDELAYRGKSKSYAPKAPLVLDFFRTDCSPCRAQLPKLSALAERWQPHGVRFLLVALLEPTDGAEKLDAYLKAHPVPFGVVVDRAEHYAAKYLGDPVTLPATFVLNADGRIASVHAGATSDALDAVKKALAQLKPLAAEPTPKAGP